MSRDVIVNLLVVSGLLLLTAGLGLVWLPLGVIAGGLSLIVLAVLWP